MFNIPYVIGIIGKSSISAKIMRKVAGMTRSRDSEIH